MKRKIFSLLLCLLMVSQCAVFAFAEEIYGKDAEPTVELKGLTSLYVDPLGSGDTKSDVAVIGYKISWGNPSVTVTKRVYNNKYWDPSTLFYVKNDNDPNPLLTWSWTSNTTIAWITNLSNVPLYATAYFNPSEIIWDTGLTLSVNQLRLEAATEGTPGECKELVFDSNELDKLGDSVKQNVYNALSGATTAQNIGQFEFIISPVSAVS